MPVVFILVLLFLGVRFDRVPEPEKRFADGKRYRTSFVLYFLKQAAFLLHLPLA